jgi:hypothetical protein
LDLCRGAVFEDNVNRVQTFSPGQVIAMKAILPIPHEGPMNVSIVKTATNVILGNALIVFDSYADEALPVLPANNTNFSITMPTNLAATDCKVAGECVLQWFWFGTGAQQTYESCVDFVMASPAAKAPAAALPSAAPSRTLKPLPGKMSTIAPPVQNLAVEQPAVAAAVEENVATGGVVSSIPIADAVPIRKSK